MSIKERIDTELSAVTFSEKMKNMVFDQLNEQSRPVRKFSKVVATLLTLFLLAGAGVCAGQVFYSQTYVNDTVIPDLDTMKIIEDINITHRLNDPHDPYYEYFSYDYLAEELGVSLLDSDFAQDQPFMHIDLRTDDENYCDINVMNYILGDTSNHVIVDKDNGRCQCTPGKEFYSPVHLKINMILSQEQYDTGWNVDYLGYYEFVESYISSQGYKVNIIQDTTYKEASDGTDIVSEKCFIFVADGIRYTLKGRTSIENMKEIIDGMHY